MTESTSRLNLIQRAMQRDVKRSANHPSNPTEQILSQSDDDLPTITFDQEISSFEPLSTSDFSSDQHTEGRDVRLNFAALHESRIILPGDRRSVTYNEFRAIKRKLVPMARSIAGDLVHNRVMVTSALPGEGKSYFAINLAIGLAAETDLDVILVDSDVLVRQLKTFFVGDDDRGLLDLLTGKTREISEVLHRCRDLPNLHLLFSGKRDDSAPELFASDKMANICNDLSQHFPQCMVIFDTPPVLAASESTALVSHMHQLVMVVAAMRATRNQVEDALSAMAACPNISMIFNKAPKWQREGQNSYYHYGYGKPDLDHQEEQPPSDV